MNILFTERAVYKHARSEQEFYGIATLYSPNGQYMVQVYEAASGLCGWSLMITATEEQIDGAYHYKRFYNAVIQGLDALLATSNSTFVITEGV